MAFRSISSKLSPISAAVKTSVRHLTNTTETIKDYNVYPHLKQGTSFYYSFNCTKELFVFMVDMPGISQKELKLWAENDQKVMFEGEEIKKHKFERSEHPTRLYRGSCGVDPNTFDTGRVKGVIVDGVLTVKVPRRVPLLEGPEKPTLRPGEWIEIHLAFTRLRIGG